MKEQMWLADDEVPVWSGGGILVRGEALTMLGDIQEGLARMHDGLAAALSAGILICQPRPLGFLAEAEARAGRTEEGLSNLAEALAGVEETDERHWEQSSTAQAAS